MNVWEAIQCPRSIVQNVTNLGATLPEIIDNTMFFVTIKLVNTFESLDQGRL